MAVSLGKFHTQYNAYIPGCVLAGIVKWDWQLIGPSRPIVLLVDWAHLPSSKLEDPERRFELFRLSKSKSWEPSVVLPVKGLPVQNWDIRSRSTLGCYPWVISRMRFVVGRQSVLCYMAVFGVICNKQVTCFYFQTRKLSSIACWVELIAGTQCYSFGLEISMEWCGNIHWWEFCKFPKHRCGQHIPEWTRHFDHLRCYQST